MKSLTRNLLTSALSAAAFTLMPASVYALKYDSEYQQVVNERDQARKERDEAVHSRDETYKKWIEDLRRGNPQLDKQLDDLRLDMAKRNDESRQAVAKAREDSRLAEAAALARTVAEQQRSGKWQSIALAGIPSCFLFGMVVGVAIGTKARKDHISQQTGNAPAGSAGTVVAIKE